VSDKKFKYLAFFDLDRTILSVNSATSLVKESLERRMMSRGQYRHALYLSILYKLEWRDTTQILHQMLGWLNGLSKEKVEQLCRDVWQTNLNKLVRPEIIAEFDYHRRQEGGIILLSSATSFVCDPVVKDLKMDGLVCTYIKEEQGILKGVPVRKLVFGREKKHRLQEFCETEGYNAGEAWYYGDSISDQYVLEAVGNPVCVDPDRKLKRLVEKRGWKLLEIDRPD